MINNNYIFRYPYAGIQSINSLAMHLNISCDEINYLLENINDLYVGPIDISKASGGTRPIYKCHSRLKFFLKQVNKKIFKPVQYPEFLQGSISGRDIISNASIHLNAQIICSLDIKSFYTNITSQHVSNLFEEFFHFSKDVASVLTKLTTINNQVPQGAPCSSFIANLVFFRTEVSVVKKLNKNNFRYTRYIDDISISSTQKKTRSEISEVFTIVIGMLRAHQFRPHPSKTTIAPSDKTNDLLVTKISIIGNKAVISKRKRDRVRAAVHDLKKKLANKNIKYVVENFQSVEGRVHFISKFHPKEGISLLNELKVIKEAIRRPLFIHNQSIIRAAIKKYRK